MTLQSFFSQPSNWVPLVIIAIALVWAFRPSWLTTGAARLSGNPGRALLDSIDEAGKDAAGKVIESRLGEVKAREMLTSLARAFDNAATPTPAAPTSGPSPPK